MSQDANTPVADLVQQIELNWPSRLWCGVNTVVAVSGGADSTAMLHTLVTIKRRVGGAGRLIAAHFHHGLRGADADADQAAVEQLCVELATPLVCERAPQLEPSEEAARDARYAFLTRAAEQHGARFLAVAHTLDDQVETVLHRVLRGSGVAGLAGIPFTRPLSPTVTLVRPLLGSSRREVEAYLADLGQSFCQDTTNQSSVFTRNWIRGELLPLLRERLGTGVDGALVRLGEHAAEVADWLAAQADAALREAVTEHHRDGATVVLRLAVLHPLEPLLVCEVFRAAWRQAGWPEQAMGRQQWRLLAELALTQQEHAPLLLPGAVRAERLEDSIVLTRE